MTGDSRARSRSQSPPAAAVFDRLRHLLVVSRPRFWLYLAGPVLVGTAYGATTPAEVVSPAAVALVAYFLVPANVVLYGVNDVFDADVDAGNPKKESGPEARYRGERVVPAAVVACAALLVPVALAVPPAARPWLAGWLVLGVAYSAPPVRLKTTPVLDSASNGLYVLPGAAAYAALAGGPPPLLALVGGWLWAMGMHAFSAVPDVGPDRRAGIRTTATVLGVEGTYAFCAACWLGAAAAFAALDPRLGAALAVYPPLVAAIALSSVPVSRAYWWFPAVNVGVGMALTLGGLWRLVG